jgi:hypothetical protein
MEVIGRSAVTCSAGRSSPTAQAPVRWQSSSEVRQEPERAGNPTRCLFLPGSAIRALLELGGSEDKIHTMNWIRRAAS